MFQPLEPEQKSIHERQIKEITSNRQAFFELIFWCFQNRIEDNSKLALGIFFKTYLNNVLASRVIDDKEKETVFDELVKLILMPDVISLSVKN